LVLFGGILALVSVSALVSLSVVFVAVLTVFLSSLLLLGLELAHLFLFDLFLGLDLLVLLDLLLPAGLFVLKHVENQHLYSC
jgi:hypothetical protein